MSFIHCTCWDLLNIHSRVRGGTLQSQWYRDEWWFTKSLECNYKNRKATFTLVWLSQFHLWNASYSTYMAANRKGMYTPPQRMTTYYAVTTRIPQMKLIQPHLLHSVHSRVAVAQCKVMISSYNGWHGDQVALWLLVHIYHLPLHSIQDSSKGKPCPRILPIPSLPSLLLHMHHLLLLP